MASFYGCHYYNILHNARVNGSSWSKPTYLRETGRLKTNAKQCRDMHYSRLRLAGSTHLFASLQGLQICCTSVLPACARIPKGSQPASLTGSQLAASLTPCLAPATEDLHFQHFWARSVRMHAHTFPRNRKAIF